MQTTTTPLTWLENLEQDATNPDLMHVSVGIQEGCNIASIEFVVSLSHMGLTWDDEFEMEFSKDLQRDMDKFYIEHHRIPLPVEYQAMTERHLYC